MKRWSNGKHKTSSDEVFVHFKRRLGAQQSHFTVNVPAIFSDRQFFFSSLVVLPDFYSLEALYEGLDDPTVFNTEIPYEIQFKVNYLDSPAFYADEYTIPAGISTPPQLVQSINAFFEAHKPTMASRLGSFLDWIDVRFNPTRETWQQWMEREALAYYGQALDPALHFNALPVSARSIKGVNNYLYPTHLNEVDKSNIRFRMAWAPNSMLLFSTHNQLQALGFSVGQIGERKMRSKYKWPNESNANYLFVTAEDECSNDVQKTPVFRMSLAVLNKNYLSESVVVLMKKGDSIKNINFINLLKPALENFSYEANVKLGLAYNEQDHRFTFTFPEDRAIALATLIVPSELGLRLGFNLVTEINIHNKKGEPVPDTVDVKQTEAKARALGYDTGVIIVSDNNRPANTAAGISEQFMCSLYPTPTGTFEISLLENCFAPPTTPLPNFYDMQNNTIPATFNLSRYLDDGSLTKLDWKNTAFVSGLLRGGSEQLKKHI
jgi:hypothetical protein